jgi:hypothetical protein
VNRNPDGLIAARSLPLGHGFRRMTLPGAVAEIAVAFLNLSPRSPEMLEAKREECDEMD